MIAILAAILLPALSSGKRSAQRVQCIANLKEVGMAFQIFAHDHRGKFPMQIPVAEGGSEEYVVAGLKINGPFYFSYRHLQTLANELVVPRLLICPADITREAALNFSSLQNSNVSYFVNAEADYNQSETSLAGDRNITNNAGATASLVRGTYGLRWTRELHSLKGNVLFSDAHVEQLNNVAMNLPGATVANSVFFLPAVPISGTTTGPVTDPVGGAPGPTVSQGNPPPPVTPFVPPPGSSPNAPGPAGGSPAGAPPGLVAASQTSAAPGASSPNSPYAPMRSGMSGSAMTTHQMTLGTIIQANARETNAVAVNSNSNRWAAAPAATDEDEPPLLWLQGAAHAAIAKTSWWLWLLLALLIAAAAYLYSRRKKSSSGRRRV